VGPSPQLQGSSSLMIVENSRAKSEQPEPNATQRSKQREHSVSMLEAIVTKASTTR
jgi:hypothetical protein